MRRILGLQLLDWLWLFIIALMGAVTIFGLVGCETPGREQVDAVSIDDKADFGNELEGLSDDEIVERAYRRHITEGIAEAYMFWANPATQQDMTIGSEKYQAALGARYMYAQEVGDVAANQFFSDVQWKSMQRYIHDKQIRERIRHMEQTLLSSRGLLP